MESSQVNVEFYAIAKISFTPSFVVSVRCPGEGADVGWLS